MRGDLDAQPMSVASQPTTIYCFFPHVAGCFLEFSFDAHRAFLYHRGDLALHQHRRCSALPVANGMARAEYVHLQSLYDGRRLQPPTIRCESVRTAF
jgi:hypothetical protein